MLEPEAKASICSGIKEHLILFCQKFLAFVVAVINYQVLSQKETLLCNRVINVLK